MQISFHEKGRDPHYKIWHCIDGNMIIYMYTDGGNIVFQDKIFPIEKGVLCFIGADKRHYTMPEDPTSYERSKIYLPEMLVHRIAKLHSDQSAFCRMFFENSVIYARIPENERINVENLFCQANDSACSPESFICAFFRLMLYLEKYSVTNVCTPSNSISLAVDFINKNYSRQFSLDQLCAEIHMSKYHFCRKFRHLLGTTVMEYVLETRLAAAKNMLVETSLCISEISEKCGFSSVSYFCRVFRENFGVTALQYRKK